MVNSENPYVLSALDHAEIRDVIFSENLGRCTTQEQPRAFITGGQPGAGKSLLAEIAKTELREQGGYLVIDADRYRNKHPLYGYLQQTEPTQAANYVHKDAGMWATELKDKGIQERYNVLIDQTSKDPDALLKLGRELREAGYRVELHILAVSAQISEQRIHSRYENQMAVAGFGRFATKDNHDYAYNALPLTVSAAEEEQAVDRIVLYDKNSHAFYENHLLEGQWSNSSRAAEALIAERHKPLTAQEQVEFVKTYDKLVGMAEARKAPADELKTLKSLQVKAHSMQQTSTLKTPVEERPKAGFSMSSKPSMRMK
jgi:predicted ABC-type ATPase